jgi:hypothetical protein
VYNTTDPVLTDYMKIPKDIMDLNRDVTLTTDVMFVSRFGFLVSAAQKLKFATIEHVPHRTKPILIKSLKKMFNIKKYRGFKVSTALMDNEFEPLRNDIKCTIMNTTASSEHVPKIVDQIRVIKESARAIRSTFSLKKLPNQMIIDLINFIVLWINSFPSSSGVSDTYSLRTIMTGTALDYEIHCRMPFRAYVETCEENTPTTMLVEKIRGAICIGPTSDFQASYKFLCLSTRRRIMRNQFREVPVPASVINRYKRQAIWRHGIYQQRW